MVIFSFLKPHKQTHIKTKAYLNRNRLMKQFDSIEHLKTGNDKQRKIFELITKYRVFEILKEFDPILAGTIPIEVDTDKSDLDIICYWKDKYLFSQTLKSNFSSFDGYQQKEKEKRDHLTIMACFSIEGFEFEIFGQNRPTKTQEANRHMIIEHKLLLKHGEQFRHQVIELKKQGVKTEPAFAQLLGLETDNPFDKLLEFENE